MNSKIEIDEGRRVRPFVGIAGVLAVALAVVWWPGCRQYEPVTSERSLYLMKLLYAACNTKDPVRLAKVEQGVADATRDGLMSEPEHESFGRIIGMAKEGRWERAEKEAYRFALDQVGQGSSAPSDACCTSKRRPAQRK